MAVGESLGTAFVDVQLRLDRLQRDLDKARKRTQITADKMADGFKKVGRNLTLFVTAPLLALGAASAKTALTFGSSLTKLRTLVGLTADEVEFLKQGVLDIGPAVGKGPNELAKALFPIVSAGARGSDALDRLRLAGIGSALGMGEVIVPATALNKIMAIFGDEIENADEAMGVLLKTLQAADAPPEALARAFTKVLPQAKALGIDLRNVSGALAFVTLGSASASSAASGLSGVLTKLKKPPQEIRKIMEGLGLELEELQKIAGEEGIVAALRKLATVFPTTSQEFARFFEDTEALNAALIILDGNADDLARVMATVLASGAKDAADALKILEEDAAFKVEKAFAAINKTFTILGESIIPKIVPAIESFTEKISAVAEAFAGLDAETQSSILFTGALSAALGPVLLVIGSLIGIIGNLSKAFIFLGTVLRVNPLFLVGTAVALLVIGFNELFGATEKVVGVSEEHAAAMKEIKRLTDEAAAASGKMKIKLLEENEARKRLLISTALQRRANIQARIDELKAAAAAQPFGGALAETGFFGELTEFGELQQAAAQVDLELAQLNKSLFENFMASLTFLRSIPNAFACGRTFVKALANASGGASAA